MTTTNAVHTARFGCIEFTADDVVTFAEGLIGFPTLCRFLIVAHKEGSPFRWLQSIDEPSVAFLAVDPAHYLTDYAPEISDREAANLRLVAETPRLVYTVVTIPNGKPNEMTINLAGPIVINLETAQAKQVVLEESVYPIRYRVFPEGAASPAA